MQGISIKDVNNAKNMLAPIRLSIVPEVILSFKFCIFLVTFVLSLSCIIKVMPFLNQINSFQFISPAIIAIMPTIILKMSTNPITLNIVSQADIKRKYITKTTIMKDNETASIFFLESETETSRLRIKPNTKKVQGLNPSKSPTKTVKIGKGNEPAKFFIESWFIKLKIMKIRIIPTSRLMLIISLFLLGVIISLLF